jgi:branched-chain amino acid transport system ATP-binding protein
VTATATAAPPALRIDGLDVAYGEHEVLRDVNLRIEQGTVAALLGPNGAGKTTLLRTIAGLLAPRAGSISLEGTDVTRKKASRRARAGICLIPEGRGIFRPLTVRDNLLLQLSGREPAKGIEPALEAFPILAERLGQVAGTLSGGQQQMLALARCYLSGPSLILLDEVSMGLAPLIVDQIFESIGHLAARGISLLLVEQYVDRALEMASAAWVLKGGRIVFEGRAGDISRDDLVRDYLGAEVPVTGDGERDAAEPASPEGTSKKEEDQ